MPGPDVVSRRKPNPTRLPIDLTFGQPPQPTLNRSNWQPTDSVHVVAPYFKGADCISDLGLPQFLDLKPGSRAKPWKPDPNVGVEHVPKR